MDDLRVVLLVEGVVVLAIFIAALGVLWRFQ